MGILCDKNFESGKVDNEKANDIVATVSFINDAMGEFLENCILQEIYDLTERMSEQPELGIKKVTRLPHNKICHWIIKEMSYREKLSMCKKVAPSIFTRDVNRALGKMEEIRNRVAHTWSSGLAMGQKDREVIAKFFEGYDLNEAIKDINDEYEEFQKLYSENRNLILTLEQESSSEHLDLPKKTTADDDPRR